MRSRSSYGKSFKNVATPLAKQAAVAAGNLVFKAGSRALSQAASAASNAALRSVKRRLFTTPLNVKRQRRAGPKRRGALHSKSAGFFAESGKKYKNGRRDKLIQDGVNFVRETSGTIEPAVTVPTIFVGHGTCVQTPLRQQIWRAIIKRMYEKVFQDSPSDLNEAFFQKETAVFNLQWRYVSTGTQQSSNVDTTIITSTSNPLGLMSCETVAMWFADATRPFNVASSTSLQDGQKMLERLEYYEYFIDGSTPAKPITTNRHYIKLEQSKIHVDCKSSLKLQNRSIGSEGNDEADDVDNVPIYGRQYFGKGTDFMHVSATNLGTSRQPRSFTVSNLDGLIFNDNTDNVNALREPPLPGEIIGVKSATKARLDPGEIKTSNLSWREKIKLNTIYPTFIPASSATARVKRSTYGTSTFFGLEKMINTGTVGMKIAYENQFRIRVSFVEVRNRVTAQVTDVL